MALKDGEAPTLLPLGRRDANPFTPLPESSRRLLNHGRIWVGSRKLGMAIGVRVNMAAFSDPLGLIPLYGICILGDGFASQTRRCARPARGEGRRLHC